MCILKGGGGGMPTGLVHQPGETLGGGGVSGGGSGSGQGSHLCQSRLQRLPLIPTWPTYHRPSPVKPLREHQSSCRDPYSHGFQPGWSDQ